MSARITSAVLAAALAVLTVAAVAIAAGETTQIVQKQTISVIEHPVAEDLADIGKKGDSAGDVFTFHNPLFNASNTKMVGNDQGTCVRISPAVGSWECAWTTFLPGGHITVQGPFFDTHDSMLSVTGGTGIYTNVRGQMLLHARPSGGFLFQFRLQP
jgi:allene oxide cyclase